MVQTGKEEVAINRLAIGRTGFVMKTEDPYL